MNLPGRTASLVVAGAFVATLAGCSIDAVIWGQDGAHVIETTERLIDAAASGEQHALVCDGADPGLGEPQDWKGLSAGEPEHFHADYWADQASLDPAWNINLELEYAVAGYVFPGDVFYRDTENGLCVVDVVWSMVAR